MGSADGAAGGCEVEGDEGIDAWDVSGIITPGDAVGSVTERLLKVWGACVVVVVVGVEVVETNNELDDVVVVVMIAGPLLVCEIPRILSAVFVSKQPTYTPVVSFIGRAKHELPGAQVVSL